MPSPANVFVRIDSRLVHGQVTTQWCSALGAATVIVANDEVAGNATRQKLMRMAVPRGVSARFLTVADAAAAVAAPGPGAPDGQTVLVVVETPADALALALAGAPVARVNVGNVPLTEERRQVTPSVAVGEKDVAAFRELRTAGIELEVRRVPSAPADNAELLLA